MVLEKKISIGDIVAIFMAIVAIIGLGLQARSTSISEQQLKNQVKDISEVVNNIEEQKSQLHDEMIGRLNQGREIYNSQSDIHDQLLDIGRADRTISDMYLRSLMLSQSTIHIALTSIETTPEVSELLFLGREANARLSEMMSLSARWQAELNEIYSNYDSKFDAVRAIKPVTEEIPEELGKLNNQMVKDIALLNGRYTEKITPIREAFVQSQENLIDRISSIYNISSVNSANK
ncbi:hypothetical protein ACJJI3_07255 [Microbulbifer sp. ZKSA004]|uniref:hypothetical protein n=1 Tax=Microbulbifer sp. ZKSA004 TaxID=3243389 RepID=UPI0040398BE1